MRVDLLSFEQQHTCARANIDGTMRSEHQVRMHRYRGYGQAIVLVVCRGVLEVLEARTAIAGHPAAGDLKRLADAPVPLYTRMSLVHLALYARASGVPACDGVRVHQPLEVTRSAQL